MKRFLWGSLVLLALSSVSAFADSFTFTITHATIFLAPNNGSGDNVGFILSGSGFTFTGGGGTAPDYFNDQGYGPGTTLLGGATTLFIESGSSSAMIGNTSYGSDDILYSSATLFVSSITLPNSGQDTTAFVTASISVSGTILATGQTFTLVSPLTKGSITFSFAPAVGLYVPSSFNTLTSVPEPGTLALLGTGLIVVIALVRRRVFTKTVRQTTLNATNLRMTAL